MASLLTDFRATIEEHAHARPLFSPLSSGGERLNVPVEKFYTPEEFEQLKERALSYGFVDTVAGPFVRSSYHADRMYGKCLDKQ